MKLTKKILVDALNKITDFPKCKIFDSSEDFKYPHFDLDFIDDHLYAGTIWLKDDTISIEYDGCWPVDNKFTDIESALTVMLRLVKF